MSLDAAQILAPLAPGLTPAATPSAGGDASGGGDFAAMLESLAGILQSTRAPGGLMPAAPARPAAAGGALETSAALVLDIPPVPGLTRERLGLGLAATLRVETAPGTADAGETEAEAEALPLGKAPSSDGTLPGVFPAHVAVTVQASQSRGSGEAGDEADARAGAAPNLAPRRQEADVRTSGLPADALPADLLAPDQLPAPSQEAEAFLRAGAEPLPSLSAPLDTPATEPARAAAAPVLPAAGSATPPPTTLALAPGVLAVTGRRLQDPAEGAGPADRPAVADATPQAPQASPPPAEASRQAALLAVPGREPEPRPQETRRRDGVAGRTEAAAPRPEGAPAPLQPLSSPPLSQPQGAGGRIEAVQARTGGEGPKPAAENGDEPAVLARAEDLAPTPSGLAPAAETRSSAPAGVEAAPPPPRAGAETVAALAAQMARRLDDGVTRFDLQLNPGDLGRVDVRLEIDAAGGIRAAFTFEDAHAAGELGRRADELQKSLESAGFNLSGGLTFDVAGDRSQGRNPAWGDSRDSRPAPPPTAERDAGREALADINDSLAGRRASARAGVDIRI